MAQDHVERLLDEITAWASHQTQILVAALVGSHARGCASPESDIDLILITSHPQVLLNTLEWIHLFGQAEKHQIENYGRLISIRVWYAEGHEVEFGITDERWADIPIDSGTQHVISDGMQILFERDELLSRLT